MNIEQFLKVLPMIGVGMLGIFLVTSIIIASIYLLFIIGRLS